MNILITAGPTREYIDPVRFISNASSGKTAYSIAKTAVKDKAGVTIISGPVNLQYPKNSKTILVETTDEMLYQVMRNIGKVDIAIFCAAVCDFKPEYFNKCKIKKGNKKRLKLKLIFTKNIIKTISSRLPSIQLKKKVLVGFALETKNLISNALKKLEAGNLDMLIANPHTSIGSNNSQGYFISPLGGSVKIEKIRHTSKDKFAEIIWKKIKSTYEQKKRIS